MVEQTALMSMVDSAMVHSHNLDRNADNTHS